MKTGNQVESQKLRSVTSHNICSASLMQKSVVLRTADSGPAIAKLRWLGKQVASAQATLGTRFFKLCSHIRKTQLHPETVRNILKVQGLNASRVSEILKVANSSPQIFSDYKRRLIGFKLALSHARGEERNGEQAQIAVWHRFYAQFDRISEKEFPPQRIHDLNGRVLLAWRHDEVNGDKITFDQDHWCVTVERKNKPKTRQKAKVKVNEKSGPNTGNGVG